MCKSFLLGFRGLYPRVRGADRHAAVLVSRTRASTPACAGLTGRAAFLWGRRCLYPRVRGADENVIDAAEWVLPLPPRARG